MRLEETLRAFLKSRKIILDADALAMFIAGFAGLTEAEACAAILEFNRSSTDFPTVAAIRAYVPNTKALSVEQRAEFAWSEVRAAISSVGGYASVDFGPLVNAVVRQMGGWRHLCNVESAQLVWTGKEFCRMYGMVATTGAGNGAALPGIFEATNAPAGLPVAPAVRIASGLVALPVEKRIEQRPAIMSEEVRRLAHGMTHET
jgi:hypothetical protein